MNKLYTATLFGLLVGSSLLAVDIENTVLPKVIKMYYEGLKSNDMLDKASPELTQVYQSINNGDFNIKEATLNKAFPEWKIIIRTTPNISK